MTKPTTAWSWLAALLLLAAPLMAAPGREAVGDAVVLRDGNLRVQFDNRRGCRLSAVTIGDVEVLRCPQVLWGAEFRDREGGRGLLASSSAPAQVAVVGDTAELRWSDLPLPRGGRVSVSVTITFVPALARTEWTISFTGISSAWTLYRYRFPCLSLAADAGEGTALAEPYDWGTLTRDPLRRLDRSYGRSYPRASLNMQMHALLRGPNLVYLGCHDPRARTKDFVIEPDLGRQALEYSVMQPTRLQYGADYRQEYPFVLQALRGDWYDAAQIYRQWALTAPWTWRGPLHAGTKTARRFLETPLVLMRLGEEILEPEFVADWMIRTRDWFGERAVCHYYAWHQNFGEMTIAAYPEWFPSLPGFRPAVKRMEQAGIQVMPYLNARLWRTDFASWNELGSRAAAKDAYGSRHDEVWVGIPTAAMDPASRLWQWVIGEAALRVVDAGCSAVYLDQLAESAAHPCYDTTHPHAPGESGAWMQGYWQLVERIREEGRIINADLIITAEGNAEPYLAGIDSFLTGNANAVNSVPLYSAVYHDYVMFFGRYVMAEDLALPGATLAKFGEQFIFGGQFGWANGFLEQFLRDDDPESLCLRAMAHLRAVNADLLAEGRMLRPLDLSGQVPTVERQWILWDKPGTVRLPEVMNSVWQGADGKVGVLLLNLGREARHLRISLKPEEYPVAAGEGQWQVTVPALSPLLLTCAGRKPEQPTPPSQPQYDLIGYDRADPVAQGALPFIRPTNLAPPAASDTFPYRYEADELPWQAEPRWLLIGPGADRPTEAMSVNQGRLHLDTLAGIAPGALLAFVPRGPAWDVDKEVGYTVETRLRVTETNQDPHFAFWLEAHNEQHMITLQIHPDRIESASNPDIMSDMASKLRVLRLVCLPGGKLFRLYLDGEAMTPDLQGVGGLPYNSSVGFGAGASAGKIKADVDYVRFEPAAPIPPPAR